MKLFRLIQQSLCILCLASSLSGQGRFTCNGNLLVSTSDGKVTSIFRVTFAPFVNPSLNVLAIYDGHFDALGFNPKDNFVYSVEQNTNTIVRHSLYNKVERIGNVTTIDTLRSNAGDCSADGLYVCYDYGLNQMLMFDVVDNFTLLRQINLFWDPTSANKGPFKTRLFDFAFDPNDSNIAYSFQGHFDPGDMSAVKTKGAMLKINLNVNDPNLGMVTPLGIIPAKEVTHLAGLVFDPTSNLYGFGSTLGGLNPPQNTLFNINLVQGQTSLVLTQNPAQITSDACSCPFSLTFTNAVPSEGMFCHNDKKTFVLTIENNSFLPLVDVILKDTFPVGTIIQVVSNRFVGNIDPGSGVGTDILSISGLLIPPKKKIEIYIDVLSVDAKDGPVFNQAFLQNLPPRFPTITSSDDPASSPVGDRSYFFFTTRNLSSPTWKTTPPTNCLDANDGRIVVSSPDFIPGQSYEVGLINTKGWKESVSLVVIDNDNSFTIDSLTPGEYQLFKFRSSTDNCALSLKDTTILLEPPNDLFDLILSSNSPVCEGKSLLLNGFMSPEGQISWRGPEIFGSTDAYSIIENATPKRTGTYIATASYGYCTQKKSLDAEIKNQIITTIDGAARYCVRDTLRLEVITQDQDDLLTYSWSVPNDSIYSDSIVSFPIVGNEQSGYYQVITNNGACYDTIGIDVKVLPAPTLSLDDIIMTDFCDPLILSPTLADNSNVNYRWSPPDGLSCTDCPNPLVQPIVKSDYQLNVNNEYNCVDSATIKIILDKEKLVFSSNIFSAKGSLSNAEFKLAPNCVVRFIHRLDIYDRFGNQIFTTTAQNPDDKLDPWDGRISGRIASSGVYIWIAKAELVDGSIVYLKGDVTII